jgi:hypothetical protein
LFSLQEGKLLGFTVSKEGVSIDPSRVKNISKIVLPHNKKSMKSFLGQINFVKCFVPNFTQIVLPLQHMIRKYMIFKWNAIEKEDLNSIKQTIIQVASLLSPNFNKEFVLYTFSFERSYASMLSRENDQNIEVTIAFESSTLQGEDLNYTDVEKQDYEVFKSMKH